VFSLLLSSAYTESRPFLLLTLPRQQVSWGGHKKLGGDTAGTADPNWPKGYSIPYDITLCKIKLREGGGSGGHTWSDGVFSSQVTIRCDAALHSWRWPTSAAYEFLVCFACAHSFCFTY